MAVTPDRIAVALGVAAPTADDPQFEQWQMWIDDAEMLIEDRRVEVDPDLVIDSVKLDYVVREAVVQHARHPGNEVQVQTSVDDVSSMRTYRAGEGRVTIPDDLWERLGLKRVSGKAFMVDLMPPREPGTSPTEAF